MKKINSTRAVLPVIALALGLSPTTSLAAPWAGDPAALENLSILLDPTLTNRQQASIKKSVEWVRAVRTTSPLGGSFAVIFGKTPEDALRFVEKRINIVAGPRFSMEKSLMLDVSSPAETHAGGIFNRHKHSLIAHNSSVDVSIAMASAISSVPADRAVRSFLRLGKTELPYIPWKTQFIILKKPFFKKGLSPALRSWILVHEARHSDCAVDLRPAPAKSLDEHKKNMEALSPKCGFKHVRCPEEHPYAGAYACDAVDGLGAYLVGAVYSAGLRQSCANCDERTLNELTIATLDSISRVLNFEELTGQSRGQ